MNVLYTHASTTLDSSIYRISDNYIWLIQRSCG